MGRRISAWILVFGLGVAGLANAQTSNRFLRKARAAYDELEYEKVTPLLNRALKIADSSAEKVDIFQLLATMHVMFGRDKEAEQAFLEVLQRQPDFTLPETASPKLQAALKAAQGMLDSHPTPTATAPSETLTPAEPASTPFSEVTPPGTSPFTPSASTTVAVEPGRGQDEPFYSTWWFWTVTGVVVAGAAGTTAWALTRDRFPETDFGAYNLP